MARTSFQQGSITFRASEELSTALARMMRRQVVFLAWGPCVERKWVILRSRRSESGSLIVAATSKLRNLAMDHEKLSQASRIVQMRNNLSHTGFRCCSRLVRRPDLTAGQLALWSRRQTQPSAT